MAGNTSNPGASVAGRIFALLDTFDARHRSQRLSDIARRADIPLPTAHRLLRDLLEWGALTRSDSGAYQIGRRLWDLGLLAAVNTGLREIAEPFLHDIYAATLATVHIAVLDGPNALYLDRVAGHASVQVVSNVGTRLPLHSTGVGKVLLAHQRRDDTRRLLDRRSGPGPFRSGHCRPRHGDCEPAKRQAGKHRGSTSGRPGYPPLHAVTEWKAALVNTGMSGYHHGMRTQVAIIGAGPSGLLLSHLLDAEGIEAVVVESRSEEYVISRIRAGVLESAVVDLLRQVGLGERLSRQGLEHGGIYLQWPGERHHIDFVDLIGRGVWVYGQTELQKDLVAARRCSGQPIDYEVSDTAVNDIDTDHPSVTYTDRDGHPRRIDADVVVGCDGFYGPSREAILGLRSWERTYPFAWLGVLANVAPSTDELIYAWHPDGFAMHSMRSLAVSRLYLQVDPDDDIANWSDDRIWECLALRLGHGEGDWRLTRGPITEKSILPMRSHVSSPLRHGRLFLAGDAGHIVPPTGAKGLNLAIADVALLAPAIAALLRKGDNALTDSYSDTALRRVWRCTHFSWWMTTMLHRFGDDFDAELQLSQLRWVTTSQAGARGLAENYAGLPLDLP